MQFAQLNALNNYAYLGSLIREAMLHDRSHAADVRAAADAAVAVPWNCLGRPQNDALTFSVASYETRAVVYLVIAGNEAESPHNRQKAACAALESLRETLPLTKLLKEAHVPHKHPHKELLWRGQASTHDALFGKYARDARRLANQLNAYEQCIGLKLSR